jgi:hypothetical protein
MYFFSVVQSINLPYNVTLRSNTMEMRRRTVKPENIIFSEAKSYALPDKAQPVTEDAELAKRFLWTEIRAGDCQMTGIQLQFIRPGFFFFDSHIQSSGDDDSWGILHFDVYEQSALRADSEHISSFLRDRLVPRLMHRCHV